MARALCQSHTVFALLFSATALCQLKGDSSPRSFPIDSTGSKNKVPESAKTQLTNPVTVAMIPAMYIIILIVGILANGMALFVLATKVQWFPSTIFLINLAIADLLLILALPFKISYHLLGNDWPFGEGLCRAVTAFFYGNMYCSILLLTFISIDRYFALVHPFLFNRFRNNRFAVCCCSVIWLLALISMLPFLLQTQTYQIQDLNITTCHDALPRSLQSGYFFYYFVCLVVLGFLIPCLVTIFCYVWIIKTLVANNSKFTKAIRVMVLVLIVYLVCFTPSNIILLIQSTEFWLTENSELHFVYMLFLVLTAANSCIDPFIYYYISDEFREKVRSTMFCKAEEDEDSERKLHQLVPTSSSTAHMSKTFM